MKAFRFIFLCAILTLTLASCSDNTENTPPDTPETSQEQTTTTDEITTETTTASTTETTTETTTEPVKTFTFESCEDVETMSDDDLVYLAQNMTYNISNDYDFFDTPLENNESVNPFVFMVDSIDGLDINKPVPDDFLQGLIDAFFEKFASSNNTFDGTTGSEISDENIILCGENDTYKEYQVSYTEKRTFYNNDELVTNEIPRIYRYIFMKNKLTLNGIPIFFGEANTETVKELFKDNYKIYSEVSETDSDFILTSYNIHISYGDYGLCDTAYLEKTDYILNKESHKYDLHEKYVKEAEIEGTRHEYPEW